MIYKILKYYTLIAVICPILNYEKQELPKGPETTNPVFWCDCGVSEHWKTRPLKRLN